MSDVPPVHQTRFRRPLTQYPVLLPDADMPQETVYTRQGIPLKDERKSFRSSPQRGDRAPIGSMVIGPAYAPTKNEGPVYD